MTSFSYGTKWPVYQRQWDAMEAIDDEWKATFKQLGEHAISNKARYVGVEIETGVPWMMIAAIHRRESDCDFDTYLGNGEPLDEVTTLVPAGRGPFETWEEGAIDALTYDGLTEVTDWRLEKMIFYSEKYNGVGYHNKGLPSPYCWAGTTIQQPGKYVADGKFDPNAWDKQPGCCGILYAVHRLDPPAQYERETAIPPWV
jgi:lysozyme family protein